MDASRLRGIFPVIPTPVNDDDTINVAAAQALIAHLLKNGVNGVNAERRDDFLDVGS